MSITELPLEVLVLGIVIASFMNTIVKAVFMAGLGLGFRVFTPLLIAFVAGLLAARLM